MQPKVEFNSYNVKFLSDLLGRGVDVLNQRQLLDDPLAHRQQRAADPRRHKDAGHEDEDLQTHSVAVGRSCMPGL